MKKILATLSIALSFVVALLSARNKTLKAKQQVLEQKDKINNATIAQQKRQNKSLNQLQQQHKSERQRVEHEIKNNQRDHFDDSGW